MPPLGPVGPQGPQFAAANDSEGDAEMNLVSGLFDMPCVPTHQPPVVPVPSPFVAISTTTQRKKGKVMKTRSSFLAPRAPAAPPMQDPLADRGMAWAPGSRKRKPRKPRGPIKSKLSASERRQRSLHALDVQREKRAERKANPPPPLPKNGPIPRPDGQHGRDYHAGYLLHMYGAKWNAVCVSLFPWHS
jgi:hypothetical protein